MLIVVIFIVGYFDTDDDYFPVLYLGQFFSETYLHVHTCKYISTSYFELNDNQNISRKTDGVKYLLRTRIRAVLQYHLALTFLTKTF